MASTKRRHVSMATHSRGAPKGARKFGGMGGTAMDPQPVSPTSVASKADAGGGLGGTFELTQFGDAALNRATKIAFADVITGTNLSTVGQLVHTHRRGSGTISLG